MNTTTLTLDTLNNLASADGAACISDTNGGIRIITVGFQVVSGNAWNFIQGGGTINCPIGAKLCDYYGGANEFNQTSIILPKKNNNYYVFTTGMSDSAYTDWKTPPNYPLDFRFDVLNYAVVDMDTNNGNGAVLVKNKILMQDAMLSHNRMTAVRHGNGYDWWLIKPHRHKQIYYNFRVTADTIYPPIIDSFFVPMDTVTKSNQMYGIQGQCAFSPDGEWFASTEATNYGCFVYHFDRCNGHFTPYHFYPLPYIDTSYIPNYYGHSVGVCFSPNSHLLYLNTIPDIWQIDLSDTSLNSAMFITGPDTMPSFPEYYNGYLAPNGKIYISAWHSIVKSMPFIDSPDVRGLGCAFRGRGNGAFVNQYTNLSSIANMPFYGLGGNGLCIPASTLHMTKTESNFIVYPNPASTEFTVEYELKRKEGAILYMYDLSGKIVKSKKLYAPKTKEKIEVSNLSRGLYTYKISVEGGENYYGKIRVE